MEDLNTNAANDLNSEAGASDQHVSTLTKAELIAQITEFAGQLNAANYHWLVLIAEFDRRHSWSDGGLTKSCAHWLSWKCGLDLGAAREKVRVARALESLPKISQAMRQGQISFAKVRAMTRVATPATEQVLLNVALYGTAHHIEALVRQFRRTQEAEELSREARQQASRGLTYLHDEDGSLVLKLRLPAEAGALLLKALEKALPDVPMPTDEELGIRPRTRDSQDSLHVYAETSEVPPPAVRRMTVSFSARRADALAVIAESFLAHGAEALKGGDRHQIVVHVDKETLDKRASGRCELDEGPAIPVETARRMSCDASKVEITEDEPGEPLNVGRKTRTIPPALHRALKSRDQGCVFPGCTHKRYVDGHHIEHWADGGETKLSNLVSLCRFHHRAVHEGGVRVERCDDGAWRFVMKSGESVSSCAPGHTRPLYTPADLANGNAERGIHITPNTGSTKWTGERMDYGLAIDSLIYRTRRAAEAATTTIT